MSEAKEQSAGHDDAAFTARFGATPESLFGPFFVELRAMAGRHAV